MQKLYEVPDCGVSCSLYHSGTLGGIWERVDAWQQRCSSISVHSWEQQTRNPRIIRGSAVFLEPLHPVKDTVRSGEETLCTSKWRAPVGHTVQRNRLQLRYACI